MLRRLAQNLTLLWILLFAGSLLCSKILQMPVTDLTVKQRLIASLQQDIPTIWTYKDIFPNRRDLLLDQGLIDRAVRHLSNGDRLKTLFSLAEQGQDIDMTVIGGSISRGQTFTERGLVRRVYSNAFRDWWSKAVQSITGSKIIIKDLSIGGVGSDYYANCLSTHLPKESNTNLIIWELSGNDVGRYKHSNQNASQPLEQFLRNTLEYPSQPAILLLNFFNGKEFLSKRGCHDLDSEGELTIAKYYDVTELSWSRSVCPYLKNDESGMAFKYLFAKDQLHPSIAAHAQMAYILIEHIRNQFVRALSQGNMKAYKRTKSILPNPIFDQTYTGDPLCFTLLKVDETEPLNTLHVDIISSPKYSLKTYRSFAHRNDKLQGMQTTEADQFISFRFAVPSYASIKPFKKLIVLTFTKSGEAFAQLDKRAKVHLKTDKYSQIGTLEVIAARNIGPGEHELRIWSKKRGFLILALMLG